MTSMRPLIPLTIPLGPAVSQIYPQLEAALNGSGSFLPLPPNDPSRRSVLEKTLRPHSPIAADIALVLATSGSTGTPKGAQLTAAALRASAAGTEEALGGPAQWLLALPAHHIAGIQVLLRSLAAGYEPALMDMSQPFSSEVFTQAIATMTGPRRYSSLVPAQVERLLAAVADDPDGDRGRVAQAVASLDAILVGGAPLPEHAGRRCAELGWHIVTTYGSSETAGGMVYDGIAFPGSHVRIVPLDQEGPANMGPASATDPTSATGSTSAAESAPGRVWLGGPTIARGYRNGPHPAFSQEGWFRTDDIGYLSNGRLHIIGRFDQAINTGGYKVLPEVVEQAAHQLGYSRCAVIGLPSERWGQSVCLVIEGDPTQLSLPNANAAPACPEVSPAPACPEVSPASASRDFSPSAPSSTPASTPGDTATSAAPTIVPGRGSSSGTLPFSFFDASALSQLRSSLSPLLPPFAVPTSAAVVSAIPHRGPGKVDRAALVRLLS